MALIPPHPTHLDLQRTQWSWALYPMQLRLLFIFDFPIWNWRRNSFKLFKTLTLTFLFVFFLFLQVNHYSLKIRLIALTGNHSYSSTLSLPPFSNQSCNMSNSSNLLNIGFIIYKMGITANVCLAPCWSQYRGWNRAHMKQIFINCRGLGKKKVLTAFSTLLLP